VARRCACGKEMEVGVAKTCTTCGTQVGGTFGEEMCEWRGNGCGTQVCKCGVEVCV
jgi:hypothetical protein